MQKEIISYTLSIIFHLVVVLIIKNFRFTKGNLGINESTTYDISIINSQNFDLESQKTEDKGELTNTKKLSLNIKNEDNLTTSRTNTDIIPKEIKNIKQSEKNNSEEFKNTQSLLPVSKSLKKHDQTVVESNEKLVESEIVENQTISEIKAQKSKFDLKPEVDQRSLYTGTRQNISQDNHQNQFSCGVILEMEGWEWDQSPQIQDDTEEIGKIVFEIKIDGSGDIIAIKTLERSVSVKVEQIYKEALMETTFSCKSDQYTSAISKGKVTFYLRYK